ncbi:L,D-transpeptidase catalytic domain protein [Piscirickettsia salmonis LF-89 = ATCC VR-1361]|nr:L,D-transpeptidase catalytic domain protein [Piscirickettsia salmonis LF-89 = ATCC VR-1361]
MQFNENKTKKAILAQAPTLSPQALKVSLIAYIYVLKNQLTTSSIISLIDYSLPSTKKRLWVINLSTSKILFHTYVAHGKSTGLILAKYFSNQNNSHKTSIGFYSTQRIVSDIDFIT